MRKLLKFMKNPFLLVETLGYHGLLNWLDDKTYLRLLFRIHIGRNLDLENPKAFNDKLQWLKLNDHNPHYTRLVDKYEVKRIVAEQIGEEYIIKTLGVWDKVSDIDFSALPNQFVLKCTHDSGGVVICKNKEKFDEEKAKRKLKKCLKHNFYYGGREWPYKNVKPRIIAEEYIGSLSSKDVVDYKVMTFNGKAKCVFTCTKRFSQQGVHVTFFDNQWNRLNFSRHYPVDNEEIRKPLSLDKMIFLAETIAKDLNFARIDFYEIGGNPYFGEVTFFPGDGFEEFSPEEWDFKMGSWLELPIKKGGQEL